MSNRRFTGSTLVSRETHVCHRSPPTTRRAVPSGAAHRELAAHPTRTNGSPDRYAFRVRASGCPGLLPESKAACSRAGRCTRLCTSRCRCARRTHPTSYQRVILISGPLHVNHETPIARIDHPLWARRLAARDRESHPAARRDERALCTGSRHSRGEQSAVRPIDPRFT